MFKKKFVIKKFIIFSVPRYFCLNFLMPRGRKKHRMLFLQVYKLNMGQQQEKLNNYFNQVPKIQIKICLVRGKATLFDRIKIFWISAMADLQEIIKTHTKSYPSYFHTYPRNGKTTVFKVETFLSKRHQVNMFLALFRCMCYSV